MHKYSLSSVSPSPKYVSALDSTTHCSSADNRLQAKYRLDETIGILIFAASIPGKVDIPVPLSKIASIDSADLIVLIAA